jgi:trehalose synthase
MLAKYGEFVGDNVINELRMLGEKLSAYSVLNINSTAIGGGVAEILSRLVPLMNDTGVKTAWRVIEGGEEFFRVTKTIHNALHGLDVPFTQEMMNTYLRTNELNAPIADTDADFIVIHDPQPAMLIKYKGSRHGKWVWRCHIDVSSPNPTAWEFLKPFLSQYDAAVFSVSSFAKRDLLLRQFIIPPAIDPLSEKNVELPEQELDSVLEKYDIDPNRPLITQISRFDRLKDPEGVIDAYRIVKKECDCQLVLAGSLAVDDPEGVTVFTKVQEKAKEDKDIHLLLLPPFSDREINALQRASSVVLQKSLKEGFALTVSEALWKGVPVVGGNTGGISLQIIDGVNGFLVNSVGEAADRINFLLKNPQIAREMGKKGKEHVRNNFLIVRELRDYFLMFLTLLYIPGKLVQL